MPLYWADFLADTLHLTRADIGSYMLLIGAYWRKGGPLPDDHEGLQTICRCPGQDWARVKGVMASFFTVADGRWTHKRIDAELAECRELFIARVERTRAALEARNAKRNVAGDIQRDVERNIERDVHRNGGEKGNVALTQPQPQPQPHIQGQPQPQKGGVVPPPAPKKKLSATETVKYDGELKRVNRELEKLGALKDHDDGSKDYNRILELRKRQTELRGILGVKA